MAVGGPVQLPRLEGRRPRYAGVIARAVAMLIAVLIMTCPLEAQIVSARMFSVCSTGGGRNCVVDGDTARIGGVKVRIADIDAPETRPSRCRRKALLGDRATRRLRELLSAGPFRLARLERDADRYGRISSAQRTRSPNRNCHDDGNLSSAIESRRRQSGPMAG